MNAFEENSPCMNIHIPLLMHTTGPYDKRLVQKAMEEAKAGGFQAIRVFDDGSWLDIAQEVEARRYGRPNDGGYDLFVDVVNCLPQHHVPDPIYEPASLAGFLAALGKIDPSRRITFSVAEGVERDSTMLEIEGPSGRCKLGLGVTSTAGSLYKSLQHWVERAVGSQQSDLQDTALYFEAGSFSRTPVVSLMFWDDRVVVAGWLSR